MNGDLYFDGKKYISSSRAAKISGYVNDYIGQLCRDGKLDARMVGRSWYVGLESLIEHKNNNLIGTRSRGPKDIKNLVAEIAKSEEISTSKIELQAPSNSVSESVVVSSPAINIVSISPFTSAISASFTSYPTFVSPEVSSASVLSPISENVLVSPVVSEIATPKKSSFGMKTARFAMGVMTLMIALFGFRFGLFVNPDSQQQYAHVVSGAMQASAFTSVRNAVSPALATIADAFHNWFVNSKQTIFVLSGGILSHPVVEPRVSTQDSQPKQGMVVVPLNPGADREAEVQKVRNTFSDEVNVTPAGSDNGVITPVFKKANGDDYLYVMVPIKN